MHADPCKVLVIDDHEITQSGLSLLLKDSDFELCGMLRSGAETLPFIQSEAVDAVILDLGLPDMPGLALLAELVAVYDLTVIVLTGVQDPAAYATAIKLGARGAVSKSDQATCILDALEAARLGNTYQSPEVKRLLAAQHTPDIVLTPRQMAILQFLANGETNKEIGYRLRIAPPTVSFHLKEIRQKLSVDNNKKILEKARTLALI